ncbi:hypothetical protein GUQ72_000727 [Salmonella enterica subsp. enterica]|nr:hypothetical protein [Salmonella enterica subsp. enterica serovar Tudu]
MKFTDALIIAVILVGGYMYLFPKDKPTTNESLIAQFDKRDVVKRNDWKKGKVIDGVQVYSARKDYSEFQSVWSLGRNEAGAIVLTEGKAPKVEAAFALSQCNKLASAVTDAEISTITDPVFSVFQAALASKRDAKGILRASGDVGGKSYNVSIRAIGSALTFSCGIKTI